jgi:NAD(P)-dependent dehydrogenase (short-subunit alcohol dehydrogenase family)
VIVVLGDGVGEDDTAGALGAGLRGQGEVVVVGLLETTADAVAAVLAEAEERWGRLDAVVLASAGRSVAERGALARLDPEQWRERVERPLQRTLACFQGAHRRLRAGGGGSLVVIVPTLALVGASDYTPWAAVAEGQRSLAKSAARVWGQEQITVNCVAVPGVLLRSSVGEEEPVGDDLNYGGGPDRPGQPAAALGRSPDLRGDVASVVASLVSGRWAAVTGATIAVDGGVWMTP